jgi:RNA-splicing ligase RtcB
MSDRTVIDGEYNTATVMTTDFDDYCKDQIQEMVNSESFIKAIDGPNASTDGNIAIMPDTHGGAGSVIGFTMPFNERIVPNTVGVDIGCGMYAVRLSSMGDLEPEELDERIRNAVPMGRNVHSRGPYHMRDDFPYKTCNNVIRGYAQKRTDGPTDSIYRFLDAGGYSIEYVQNLCERVDYDFTRLIDSIGTLGGGNHFIEFCQSEKTGDYWCLIHSGSRGIGLTIAKHWQQKANDSMTMYFSTDDIPDKYQRYLKDNWKPNAEAIREDFDGTEIAQMFDQMSQIIDEYGPSSDTRNTDLDYLVGEQSAGYFIDMLFAQRYASQSRKLMAQLVADTLGVEIKEEIESVHNYMDFEDGIVRKGATRAHEGERAIIPLNMADGTLVVEGKGNPEWNFSAPHGAGREMSRREAHRTLSLDDFEDRLGDIQNFNSPEEILDEAPMAYKDQETIESVIGETAEIVDRWSVVHNLKAEE